MNLNLTKAEIELLIESIDDSVELYPYQPARFHLERLQHKLLSAIEQKLHKCEETNRFRIYYSRNEKQCDECLKSFSFNKVKIEHQR